MAASKIRASLLLIVASSTAACGGGPSAVGSVPPPSGGIPAAIASIVTSTYPNAFGVEVAIFKNGNPRFVSGYGLRDRGLPDTFPHVANIWMVPEPDVALQLARGALAPDEQTIFELASVSKQFTAGAIFLLQQDGKLSVTDPLSKYFPSFPNGNTITLLDLLHHASGLADYNNFGTPPDFTAAYDDFLGAGQSNYQPIVDRIGFFPVHFAPGTAYEYSNSNYLLLATIVANVSGTPFAAFLRNRIFVPLAMSRTAQGLPAPPVSDVALGYGDVGAGPRRSWQSNLAWLAGPGGLTSTVDDLEKWDRAVRSPGIFTAASLSAMFTPGAFPQSYGTYAGGWFVSSLRGHRYVWHDGAFEGFQTMNATFPDDKIDIIVLTNSGTGTDPYFIIPQLFDIALTL